MQNLPAKVTEAQQTKVLASLDAQVKKLEENVASISKMDKAELACQSDGGTAN